MKVLGIFLVALAFYYQPGGSIVCYYCPEETLSSQCTDQKNCTNQSFCKTTVLSPDVGYPFQGNEVVIRGCATSSNCLPNDEEELGNSKLIFCCTTDMCNNRGINTTSSWTDENNAAAQSSLATGAFLLGILAPLMVMWPGMGLYGQ